MLIIAGTITFDPSKTEQAKEAAAAVMAATREEPGNIDYVFTFDIIDPSTIRVYEAWESQEALDAHFETPHVAAFGKVAPELGISGMDMLKHEVASSGPVR